MMHTIRRGHDARQLARTSKPGSDHAVSTRQQWQRKLDESLRRVTSVGCGAQVVRDCGQLVAQRGRRARRSNRREVSISHTRVVGVDNRLLVQTPSTISHAMSKGRSRGTRAAGGWSSQTGAAVQTASFWKVAATGSLSWYRRYPTHQSIHKPPAALLHAVIHISLHSDLVESSLHRSLRERLTAYPTVVVMSTKRAAVRYIVGKKPFVGCVQLHLHVKPGVHKSREGVTNISDHAIEISTAAQAREGEANEAVIRLLSDVLGIPKSRLCLVYGERSRYKIVALSDDRSQGTAYLQRVWQRLQKAVMP